MTPDCCNNVSQVLLCACSGASNLGRLSNQAVAELSDIGFGKMFCLSAIGAHLSSFVQAAKNAERMIAVDGCPVACAKHVLSQADVPVHGHVVIYDLGIEKTNRPIERQEIEKVKETIRSACNGSVIAVAVHAGEVA